MRWQKRGRVVVPSPDSEWLSLATMVPTALHREGDVFRVYFAGRDARGRGRIGYVHLDVVSGELVGPPSARPVIELGPLGAFDDNGVTTASIAVRDGILYQYYTGHSLGVTVPFYTAIGLAVSNDGGDTFRKVSPAPVLGRTAVDPLMCGLPFVRVEGDRWRMWYHSCTRWEPTDGAPRHYYHIRYAESDDGVSWRPTGLACIDFASAEEYAIARPCVLKDGSLYRMWYCYRGASYRIGYAESDDGITFVRKDREAGIDVSADGWDSEMIEYPYVFDHRGERYMLYNGNGYGRTGIGLALLER